MLEKGYQERRDFRYIFCTLDSYLPFLISHPENFENNFLIVNFLPTKNRIGGFKLISEYCTCEMDSIEPLGASRTDDEKVQFRGGGTVVQAIVKNSLLRDSAGKSWNRTKWTPRARRAQLESCRCISMQPGIFITDREIARDHARFARSAFRWKRTGFPLHCALNY